jgi:hypothetical protein
VTPTDAYALKPGRPVGAPWRSSWADYVLAHYPWPVHVLKTVQPYFESVWMGSKNFEVRRADRNFQPGDLLVLAEWDGEGYPGRATFQVVMYVLRDGEAFGVQPGFVVLGLRPLKVTDLDEYQIGASSQSRDEGEVR